MKDGTRRIEYITDGPGMEGDVVVMQDVFLFEQTGVVDGKIQGRLRPTGIRPKFVEKFEIMGIHLPSGFRFRVGRGRRETRMLGWQSHPGLPRPDAYCPRLASAAGGAASAARLERYTAGKPEAPTTSNATRDRLVWAKSRQSVALLASIASSSAGLWCQPRPRHPPRADLKLKPGEFMAMLGGMIVVVR